MRPNDRSYKQTLWPRFMDRVTSLNAAEPLQEDSLLLALSLRKFLVLIWSTSEGWIAESIMELPNGSKVLKWLLSYFYLVI